MISTEELLKRISDTLLVDYTSVYYVDAITNEYYWFSVDPEFCSLKLNPKGDDFFADIVVDAKKVIYPEDLYIFLEDMKKEKLMAGMRTGNIKSVIYRLMMDGKPVYHELRMIHGTGFNKNEDNYFILGVMNIDEEYRAKLAAEKLERERAIFNLITESLVSHYDFLCYIEVETGAYSAYSSRDNINSLLKFSEDDDFFSDLERWFGVVYEEDKDRVLEVVNKDYLISTLERHGRVSVSFRYWESDKKIHYARLNITWSKDHSHFILGVESIDKEVEKEQEHVKALNIANEIARRDELTGIKNKKAYHETEKELQKEIEEDRCEAFALVVCDINDLKAINDTRGHKAGDDYICYASRMICRIFSHSPVFRVGGDEFAVLLQGVDFENREELLNRFRIQVSSYMESGDGVVIASGMSEYKKGSDKKVSEIFDRADFLMYDNKKELKEKTIVKESYAAREQRFEPVPEDRKNRLDNIFKALSAVAEGTYVYVCDMKYDYSRWSKTAVETYGLPSEYMYGAGDIWEEHIHPEDRGVYKLSINELFTGTAMDHNMQYRALKTNGEYDVCTCLGCVIKNLEGKMEYFIGSIRTMGVTGNVDLLTGFRSQYGFFEDLRRYLSLKREVSIFLMGINKFSEINEIYGYKFGNLVLQKISRMIMEQVGNSGVVYRMDGTRFAIISPVFTPYEMNIEYEKFRNLFRGKFYLEDHCIPLEFNASVVTVDDFEIDVQTIYTCLNFAYDESKYKKHGDMVEFYSDLNQGNKNRIQKIHAIRTSVSNNYNGFYLLYQPVIDMKTEKVSGAEALLRWKSEEYGVVPPDQFIPMLESDPVFPALGEWIIQSAVLQAKEYLKYNPDFIMHVNLSYTQLEKPNFVEIVTAIVNDANYPPEHLCLELTERCRLLDMDLLKNVIVNLHGHGFLTALDDFGTGFAALGIIKELPFDIVKIDRSFITRIEEDQNEREMMKHFTAIASTFKAAVCVEGVETSGMRDIIKNYPVQSLQGYFYAKPLSDEDFRIFMEEKS